MAERGCTPAETGGVQEGGGLDVVEVALAGALNEATRAGQWQLVAQLATELQARRESRGGAGGRQLSLARAKPRSDR